MHLARHWISPRVRLNVLYLFALTGSININVSPPMWPHGHDVIVFIPRFRTLLLRQSTTSKCGHETCYYVTTGKDHSVGVTEFSSKKVFTRDNKDVITRRQISVWYPFRLHELTHCSFRASLEITHRGGIENWRSKRALVWAGTKSTNYSLLMSATLSPCCTLIGASAQSGRNSSIVRSSSSSRREGEDIINPIFTRSRFERRRELRAKIVADFRKIPTQRRPDAKIFGSIVADRLGSINPVVSGTTEIESLVTGIRLMTQSPPNAINQIPKRVNLFSLHRLGRCSRV